MPVGIAAGRVGVFRIPEVRKTITDSLPVFDKEQGVRHATCWNPRTVCGKENVFSPLSPLMKVLNLTANHISRIVISY